MAPSSGARRARSSAAAGGGHVARPSAGPCEVTALSEVAGVAGVTGVRPDRRD
jgi:hypothetical protein